MSQFERVIAYIRPHRLEEVKSALALLPISGLTVSDARGSGNHPEEPISFMGKALAIPMPNRSRIVVVVPAELRETVVQAIMTAARTGDPGDGKIFIEPVLSAVRIRNRDRDSDAV